MPDKPITIKVTQEVTHKDGSPRWKTGTQIHTTREELKQRGVDPGSYDVVSEKQETKKASVTELKTPARRA